MSYRLTIRVAPGRSVVNADTGERLSDEPIEVNDTPYWRRRLVKGDVVLCDAVQDGENGNKRKGK